VTRAKERVRSATKGSRRGRQADATRGFEASAHRRAIVYLVVVKIAGLILIFDAAADQAFELPKTLFSHGTAWLLAAAMGTAVLRWGTGIVPRHPLHVVVGALVAVNAASAVAAADPYVAVFGEAGRYLGLDFILDMTVLYLAVAIALRSAADWTLLFASIACPALLAIAYGAAQGAGLDPVRWAEDSRPFSTFGNPNMFGHFLSVVAALGVGVALFYRGGRALTVRILGAGLALMSIATAGTVGTRGTLLGLAALLAVTAPVYLGVRGPTRRGLLLLGAGGLLTAFVLAVMLATSPLGQRALDTVRAGFGTQDRVLLYTAAAAEFLDRPILGHGPDNFGVVFPRYRAPGTIAVFGVSWRESAAHSWVLQSAATTGAAGLIVLATLVIGSLWSLFVRLPRLRRTGESDDLAYVAPVLILMGAAYWANALVSVGAIQVDWLPWIVFGGAAGLGYAPAVSAPATRGSRPIAALAIAAAVVLAAAGWSALAASHDIRQARVAVAAGRGDAAAAAARSAIARDAGRADYWNWLGLAHEQRNRASEASEAFAQAAARYPHEPRYWTNLALSRAREALAGRGGAEAALSAARRAVAEDPNDPRVRTVFAEVSSALGEHLSALDAVVRAIELHDAERSYYAMVADISLRLTDPRAGIPLLERALNARDDATLRAALARLQLRMGDRAGARASALRALALEPDHAEARKILTELGG